MLLEDINNKTELQKVSEATMRFMRGKYVADEVGNGEDELKFRRGGKTILTIYIRDDRYDFLVIFGKHERDKFEEQRNDFPKMIQDIYDGSSTYHDGKWMSIPVSDMETLESVKKMIIIKKKPNRKPFPKEQAVYSKCGMRCDRCLHYTGGTISEELRKEIKERIIRVYKDMDNYGVNMMLCPGCCNKETKDCNRLNCAREKGFEACFDCSDYPCGNCGIVTGEIVANSTLADDITWAILPFVDGQYGN
jgi:formylmethanofuran dehydrogenase subunit E